MLNLLSTDVIKLVTSAAVTVDVHASYMDYNGTAVTPGRKNTAISTATTTTIVPSPAASTFRNVRFLSVRNKDVSSVDVTVEHDDGSVIVELTKVTLAAGEELQMGG